VAVMAVVVVVIVVVVAVAVVVEALAVVAACPAAPQAHDQGTASHHPSLDAAVAFALSRQLGVGCWQLFYEPPHIRHHASSHYETATRLAFFDMLWSLSSTYTCVRVRRTYRWYDATSREEDAHVS
jgi:hypothetical protein